MVLLSRPPTNALTRQVYREIVAAADELGRRDDIAAVILFGGQEIFSAGDDLPELRTLTAAEAEVAARVRPGGRRRRRRHPQADRRRDHRLRAGQRARRSRWPPTGGSAATTPRSARPRSWPASLPGGGVGAPDPRGRGEQGQGAGVQRALRRRRGGAGAGPDRRDGGPRRRVRRRRGLGRPLRRRSGGGAGRRQGRHQRRVRPPLDWRCARADRRVRAGPGDPVPRRSGCPA